MEGCPNDTIVNMVKTLNPPSTDFPIKRSLNGNEESTPVPIKRFKSISKDSTPYEGSPRELRRMRADLVEARITIKDLQCRLTNSHSLRNKMELEFKEENKILRRQSEYDKKSIQELEDQLQTIRKREKDLKSQLSEIKCKYDLLKINSAKEIEMLQNSSSNSKEESTESDIEESAVVASLNRRITELETMLESAEDDAETQKQYVKELSSKLSEDNNLQKNLEQKEYELMKAKLTVNNLEYQLKSYSEFQDQAKQQADKLSRYIELEKENERLNQERASLLDQVKNKLILEEQAFDFKRRLEKYKDYDKKLMDLQIQQSQSMLQLNEWKAVAREICESMDSDSSLPHQLRSVVEKLQHQELTLTSQKVELECELKSISHESKVLKSEVEKCRKLIEELKLTGEQKQKLIHRMEKRLKLVISERDSYRRQLDSYENDLTMDTTVSRSSSQLQTQREHINNLEKLVSGYRDTVAELENDLHNAQPHLRDDIPLKIEQVARLKDEVQRLKLENDKLRQRCDQLEIKLERQMENDSSFKGGKIAHQLYNPLRESVEQRANQVENLKKEIERLKLKIKNYEQGIENSKIGDVTLHSKEIDALNEQLKSQESQTEMLRNYLKSNFQELRNVIYVLFGYKMDRTKNSLYTLANMYAEKPEDVICFQYADGNMHLLQNEFTASLEHMINLHVKQQNSIPVFLSSLTLDLFANKSMTGLLSVNLTGN
ncbi:unnamed protein product [Phyllotreta striolata]|uniref:Mitotic spindle assembly checkpoint protein MAD1 n=1 Tax=Phyllotreta striolata TaxID=444603 RepID=A0A9N9TXG5_PHYSR|nr:unnamed protein product [Phyllotreta striolata]